MERFTLKRENMVDRQHISYETAHALASKVALPFSILPELPVIFRREKSDGSVTAVFPTLPADVNGRYFTVYAHIGQHGSGSFGWYNETRAAKPEDYADLLQELRGIYSRPDDAEAVELVIYQRMTSGHRAAFNAAAQSVIWSQATRKRPSSISSGLAVMIGGGSHEA